MFLYCMFFSLLLCILLVCLLACVQSSPLFSCFFFSTNSAGKGSPGGPNDGFNEGFSFLSDGDTGLFCSSTSPTTLSLVIDGTSILSMSSSGIVASSSFQVQGNELRLGSPTVRHSLQSAGLRNFVKNKYINNERMIELGYIACY